MPATMTPEHLLYRVHEALQAGYSADAKRLLEAEISHDQKRAALAHAIRGTVDGNTMCWIRDVFDAAVVYRCEKHRSDSEEKLYRAPYTMDAAGKVTLGTPQEVRAVMSYEPVPRTPTDLPEAPEGEDEGGRPMQEAGRVLSSQNEGLIRQAHGHLTAVLDSCRDPMQEAAGAGESSLQGDTIPLVEAAVGKDGTALLKIAAPGWGQSGYYSRELLERDGPAAFPAGTMNFWNHPTPEEQAARPEGDLRNLASVTVEPARFLESGPAGPGLYARTKVRPEYRDAVNWLADYIGTSMNLRGRAKPGEAEGRAGAIVERLIPAKLNSVDYVTRAGAGGQVVQLFEAARGGGRLPIPVSVSEAATQGPASPPVPPHEGVHKMDEKEVQALRESMTALQSEMVTLKEADTKKTQRIEALETENSRLREAQTAARAARVAASALTGVEMPKSTRERVINQAILTPPTKADGALDEAALTTRVREAAQAEIAYLQEAAGYGDGRVRGMGGQTPPSAPTPEDIEKGLSESFRRLGLSEAGASIAARGRVLSGAVALFLLAAFAVLLASPAVAETNRVYSPGYQLSVVCSDPTTPSSGAPVRYGKLTGVAMTDENTDGYTSVDFGPGVWDVYVYDEGGAGVAVGDPIYYDDTAAGSPSVNLTNSSTGAEAFFGVAMETISAGQTTEIQVRHIEVGLMSTLASNAVVSATITDATIVTADIAENGVAADNTAVLVQNVILCGENAENGTTYFGPATAPFGGDGSASYAIGSSACDALDNTTEGTADAPLTTGMPAFKVMGFYCKTDGTLGSGESIVFTLRSAAADTTPALTCTISEAGSTCSEADGSTTDIAAGATLAMKVVETSNNADDNAWCNVAIAVK